MLSKPVKHFIAVLLVLGTPCGAVLALKRTTWGPILSVPASRIKGDPHAKVTIVEYSDFQCPSCAHIQPFLHSLMDAYKGKARLAYKYYPLVTIHKNAEAAAQAAECAAQQNMFWPYHDTLFTTQESWAGLADATTTFYAIASQVGTDRQRFDACLANPEIRAIIRKDAAEARDREINATPTFIVGEQRLVANVFATEGARAIERELRK